ncbi:hypothetical protein OCK74_13335 [Chitinophagaceae bacterium LB-8]|uniref:HTTM-like domain-containing protein n=1 Tax=Paraflavisolibacter caeni TaxID=2982496 RepID=A0A9X3B842_9BACT|nr:hypothetical protein [Paraflavisolibacter caeni]MCU7550100.1 hypothetical protein [Paraflavisolibacter caeni]
MILLEKFLFQSYNTSTKHLAIYRIIYCVFIIVFTGLPSFNWLSNYFNYFFSPPKLSIANLFDSFPNQSFFTFLSVINIISFFFIFWGIWTKYSSIIFTCTYILGSNFVFSFGKIDHGILLYITPLFLGLAGWGRYYSFDNWRRKTTHSEEDTASTDRKTFIISVLALMIGFSFFTAGIVKAYGGWWKWNVEAVRFHLYDHYYSWERVKYLANFFIKIDNHLFWKLLDYLTLSFEIGFLLSVVHRNIFKYFLSAAVIFHCFVLLMFNITFAANLIVYLLFIDWEKFRYPSFINKPNQSTNYKIKIIAFLISLSLLFCWIYKALNVHDTSDYPSIIGITMNLLSKPDISTILIFLLSIPTLAFILFIQWKMDIKTTQ